MSHQIQQILPEGVEGEAEFSNIDDERQPTSCQKPDTGGRCYNPSGANSPPGGVLHRYTSRLNQVGYMVCTPCKQHLDSKASTITRNRVVPTTSSRAPSIAMVSNGNVVFNFFHAFCLIEKILLQGIHCSTWTTWLFKQELMLHNVVVSEQ